MLKKIVFILSTERAIDEAEGLISELTRCGIEVYIIGKPLRSNEDKALFAATKSIMPETESVLYITDEPSCHQYLCSNNLPVIIYLHDANRNKNFSYAEYAIENIDEIEYESLKLAYQRLTGQPWIILETDRCIIRETTIDDVDSFYEIYKEPSITQYMENLYEDKDAEIEYIKDYIKNVYAFYGYGMWTVLEKTTQSVIGRAGISWREGYDIPELGFMIALPYQGKGYAYEVCQAIIRYGHSELMFDSLQALIMEGNEKSIALCEKLGFVYEEKVELCGIYYDRMILNIK